MNQKKDFNMIAKKLETELKSFHFDGLEISEITTSISWMRLHINVLFIKDTVQITKVLYKDYQTGLWYYIKDKGMVISHKDTFNHTIKNLIDEMIYDVHIEIEEAEDIIENEDIDEIENINHDCESVHKQMKAKSNPEWHHVSIATLANIDFDMLDEKRKLVFDINQILKDGIRNLYKCENHISFEVLERYVIRKCDELIRRNRLKAFWFSYIARQLDEVRRNTIYLYTPYITAHRNRW